MGTVPEDDIIGIHSHTWTNGRMLHAHTRSASLIAMDLISNIPSAQLLILRLLETPAERRERHSDRTPVSLAQSLKCSNENNEVISHDKQDCYTYQNLTNGAYSR